MPEHIHEWAVDDFEPTDDCEVRVEWACMDPSCEAFAETTETLTPPGPDREEGED